MTKAEAAFQLSFGELEGVDELSSRVFNAFLDSLRLHRQLMVAALAEHGSHPGQAMCLRILAVNDGISQRDLVGALHHAPPTVTKMLQALEKAGLIERRPDERDQRLTRVFVTAAGHELAGALQTVSGAVVNETIGALPERDRRELERLLNALSGNISAALATRSSVARRDQSVTKAAKRNLP